MKYTQVCKADHHVLGSSINGANPIFTVFSHQAVGMQVDIFSICDQLNNNLCRSNIFADFDLRVGLLVLLTRCARKSTMGWAFTDITETKSSLFRLL